MWRDATIEKPAGTLVGTQGRNPIFPVTRDTTYLGQSPR